MVKVSYFLFLCSCFAISIFRYSRALRTSPDCCRCCSASAATCFILAKSPFAIASWIAIPYGGTGCAIVVSFLGFVLVLVLCDLDFEVFESASDVAGLLQVPLGVGGDLLHFGQITLCNCLLNCNSVGRRGAATWLCHCSSPF